MKDFNASSTDPLTLSASNGFEIVLRDIVIAERYSFLDYIFGGCEIGIQIAIDYTLSNGHPKEPFSLHFLNPETKTNQYIEAIQAVMDIVKDYDAD